MSSGSLNLQAKALLFDIMVLAEIDIDYLPATRFLKEGVRGAFPLRDILKQLSETSHKISKDEYPKWISEVSNELDEIETKQIDRFQLHMGVKNGLDSLRHEGLPIYVLTEMGRKAGMQFLSQHSISQYIVEVISRDDTKGLGDTQQTSGNRFRQTKDSARRMHLLLQQTLRSEIG